MSPPAILSIGHSTHVLTFHAVRSRDSRHINKGATAPRTPTPACIMSHDARCLTHQTAAHQDGCTGYPCRTVIGHRIPACTTPLGTAQRPCSLPQGHAGAGWSAHHRFRGFDPRRFWRTPCGGANRASREAHTGPAPPPPPDRKRQQAEEARPSKSAQVSQEGLEVINRLSVGRKVLEAPFALLTHFAQSVLQGVQKKLQR